MLRLVILLAFVQNCLCGEVFTVSGSKILDANGKEFLIRGINSANADWDNYGRYYAQKSIKNIASTGANTIRIQWRVDGENKNQLSSADLDKTIQTAVNNKLIVILQLHDATGSSNRGDLNKCADWFKRNVALLNKYKKYIIVNIANEWSPWGTKCEEWRDAYNDAVKTVRSSGWAGTLLVDGSAYAQNPECIIQYGNDILSKDPKKNVAFSLHMYAEWQKGGRNVGNALWDIQAKGLAVVVGEFALSHPEGCKWVDIDAWEIMRQCKWKNVGYLGWSWHGNGVGDCNIKLDKLNVVNGDVNSASSWQSNSYSEWGNCLINYTEFGIKDSSKRASVF